MTTIRKPVMLFDVDGTLADLSHRLHFVTSKTPDWKSFNAGIPDDKPIEQTIFLNKLFASTIIPAFDIVLASGRSEDERAMTETWLAKYGIFYKKLYMRPAGDYRPDYVIKLELLEQMRADGYEPYIVIDDRISVVQAWREAGLFVLQCDPNRGECGSDVYKFHSDIKWPLTIMVGPSGAGKSTWINHNIDPSDVISSDALRQKFCGDFQDQSQNERVFRTMHELADKRLKAGLPVVLDATHIRRADRLKSALIAPKHIPVRYVVINRSLKEKIADGGWRNGVIIKGKSLIETHDQTFKSNLKDILKGDDLPNVTVIVEDCRA